MTKKHIEWVAVIIGLLLLGWFVRWLWSELNVNPSDFSTPTESVSIAGLYEAQCHENGWYVSATSSVSQADAQTKCKEQVIQAEADANATYKKVKELRQKWCDAQDLKTLTQDQYLECNGFDNSTWKK